MEVPVTVVPQRPKFIFDRSKVKNVIGQCFDQELSLRWQFVQLRAGKSLPFVVLPQLSRPPQHLDEEDPDEPIDGIYVIADELKSLHKDGELRLDGCTPDQIRLANALSEAWRLLHLGTVTDFPSKFSFRYRLTPDMAPTIMTEADYGPISANEIWKLQKLLEEFRYDWFLHHDKEARDRMKLSETRISELEVGMTRQHNSISKEYEAWAENIQVDPFILDDPFEKIPDTFIQRISSSSTISGFLSAPLVHSVCKEILRPTPSPLARPVFGVGLLLTTVL
ncbi:hypothetical protein CEP54_007538 [Fusarium duplospermum]|uniref:Uncharacterized protein n=1 Tax=Fusarium duplospermum TaxID=1325734 RepID=A0A428Q0F4_9HYPO|nr:hypothetical protein CEP54_007538 [Fusarium duplospermum]